MRLLFAFGFVFCIASIFHIAGVARIKERSDAIAPKGAVATEWPYLRGVVRAQSRRSLRHWHRTSLLRWAQDISIKVGNASVAGIIHFYYEATICCFVTRAQFVNIVRGNNLLPRYQSKGRYIYIRGNKLLPRPKSQIVTSYGDIYMPATLAYYSLTTTNINRCPDHHTKML